ncbi:MAG: PAS domain-containing protein [Rhodospirillales bacterium]|nr:PAS domain-containing protein [Rhodospirillales bacterium]
MPTALPSAPRPALLSSVRGLLVALACAIGGPLFVFSLISLRDAYDTADERQRTDLLSRAQAAAATLDMQFQNAFATLRVLAASRALQSGDLDAFDHEMRDAAAALDGPLINLVSADGETVLTTFWAPGDRHLGVRASAFVLNALAQNRTAISDLVIGSQTRRAQVGVVLPVPDPQTGKPRWMLSLYLPLGLLAGDLEALHLPPDWLASILDSQGRSVARRVDADTYRGRSVPADLLQAINEQPVGIMGGDHVAMDGRQMTTAYARAPESGYVVTIGIPSAVLAQPLKEKLREAGLIGGVLLALSIVLALLLSRRIIRGLDEVAAHPSAPRRTGLVEIDRLGTALAEAERERGRAAEEFRTLADTLPGWMFVADEDGRNVFVNQTFAEQVGRTAESLMGTGWLDVIHPDDRAGAAASWRVATLAGTDYVAEYRARMRDGTHRWFLCRGRPVKTSTGMPIRWFGVAVDIQDRKSAEAALREAEQRLRALNLDLETRVEREAAAREAAMARAAHGERMQALGQLAGGIAHDFNNVLQAVQGGAALIRQRVGDPPSIERLARMVEDAAIRGATVTRRLLSFARRGELRAEPVDLARLLQEMQEVLAPALGAQIRLHIDAPDGLPPALVDKGQVETVLVNLATNARDAMPEGGDLTLSLAHDVIAPEAATSELGPGQYLRLTVADTGHGMDPATRARALEPFFTTKPQGKGTGLGLSMAKGFAEQSGGALALSSTPACGTTVELWLPQAGTEPAASPQTDRPLPIPASRRRVLPVDDEAIVLETLATGLSDLGFAVAVAANGAEALALIESGEPLDALVTDLTMPGMSGLALIREAQDRRPNLPAILLTGYATDAAQFLVGGAVAGRFSLLRKPVLATELVERLETMMGLPPAAGQGAGAFGIPRGTPQVAADPS